MNYLKYPPYVHDNFWNSFYFYWNKARNCIYSRKYMCSHWGIPENTTLFLFWLGMWSIPSILMSDIHGDCTMTNSDSNQVNLGSAEGRPLVRFFILTKLDATFGWNVPKCMFFSCRLFIVYSRNTKTKH